MRAKLILGFLLFAAGFLLAVRVQTVSPEAPILETSRRAIDKGQEACTKAETFLKKEFAKEKP